MGLFDGSMRACLVRASTIRRMLEVSAGMKNVIHMEQGEPDFVTPKHILEAAKQAIDEGYTHYTAIDGNLELREAIAEKLERDNSIAVDPKSEVTVTSGSQETMLIAALGFLNRGDEALILDPYYPAYYEDTLLAEAKPVMIPLDGGKDYAVDTDALESKVTSKTRMIWMCNPSNPTGHVFTRQDLEAIAETAKKHNLVVFSDEIYEKIVYGGSTHLSIAAIPGMEDKTITVNGFSKAYAMTGWRIGYAAAAAKVSVTLRKLHYYATLCPNAISQKAALAALRGPQDCVARMLAEYGRRRLLLLAELGKIEDLSFTKPKGAFYVFPDFSKYDKSDEMLALRLLNKAGVVTAPGSGFGEAGRGHIRISYSISFEQVRDGAERIKRGLDPRPETSA